MVRFWQFNLQNSFSGYGNWKFLIGNLKYTISNLKIFLQIPYLTEAAWTLRKPLFLSGNLCSICWRGVLELGWGGAP